MAVPGVKFGTNKSIIVTALKKSKGVLTHAAKALKVAPITLRRYINKDDKLKKLLDDLRCDYDLTLLDDAENCLHNAVLQQKEDMQCALKASFFILNNKGEERGYSHKNNPENKSEMYLVKVDPTKREDDPVPT